MSDNPSSANSRQKQNDYRAWLDWRNANLVRRGPEAVALAHQKLANAARMEQPIWAPQPNDVVALGASVIAARDKGRGDSIPRRRGGPIDELLAGARGAEDALTFGVGDRIYAGAEAIGDIVSGHDFGDSYAKRIAAEGARDLYDAKHHAAARTVGQVVGTGAQVALLGGLEGAVLAGRAIPLATRLGAREVALLSGAGGALGLSGQGISDIAQRRVSSAGDYLGAGLGGAASAFASRFGNAGIAGGVGGVVTSGIQDLANRRPVSVERARQAGLVGAAAGAFGGVLGRTVSHAEPIRGKEALGETFSRVRTWARGDKTAVGPKSREYLKGGGWTVPDQRTYRGLTPSEIVESKFGNSAKLSKRQTQAVNEGLSNYRIDHTRPAHIGAIFGFPMSEFGYQYASSKRAHQP